MTAGDYTYFVEVCKDSGHFVAKCAEFPELSVPGTKSHIALQWLRADVEAALERHASQGTEPPAPKRGYPETEHDRMALLPVQERPVNEAAFIIAAQSDRQPKPHGPTDGHLWRVEGRAANLIFKELGNGWAKLNALDLEVKRGTTVEDFWHNVDRLDVRIRNNPLEEIGDEEQRYRDEYPGNLVPFRDRKFPASTIYFAAGGYRFGERPDIGHHMMETDGRIATVIHKAKGYGWGRGGIQSVTPKPGHTADEFWTSLQDGLSQPGAEQARPRQRSEDTGMPDDELDEAVARQIDRVEAEAGEQSARAEYEAAERYEGREP